MLTCITCSKQKDDGTEEGARGTQTTTKAAVKSLTAQIKDIALKVTGSSKGSKPSTPSSYRRGSRRPYPDFGTTSEGVPFPANSSSTPPLDLTNSRHPGSRIAGGFPGNTSPGGRSISAAEMVAEENHEPNEWIAQVEPGVQITFISLPSGGNDLKRIRFSREMYDKYKAQIWWGESFDRVMELYDVRRFNRQALDTPARSDNGRDSAYSRAMESPLVTPSEARDHGRNFYRPSGTQGYSPIELQERDGSRHLNAGSNTYGLGEASRTTTSSREEASVSISDASEMESEWIEEDEPGVHITIRQLADGTRELRRVRFSREKYGEVHAKLWWESNKDRIQVQYL